MWREIAPDERIEVKVEGFKVVAYSFGKGPETVFCVNGGPGLPCDYLRDSHSCLIDHWSERLAFHAVQRALGVVWRQSAALSKLSGGGRKIEKREAVANVAAVQERLAVEFPRQNVLPQAWWAPGSPQHGLETMPAKARSIGCAPGLWRGRGRSGGSADLLPRCRYVFARIPASRTARFFAIAGDESLERVGVRRKHGEGLRS